MATMDLGDSNNLLRSVERARVEGRLDLYRPRWTRRRIYRWVGRGLCSTALE